MGERAGLGKVVVEAEGEVVAAVVETDMERLIGIALIVGARTEVRVQKTCTSKWCNRVCSVSLPPPLLHACTGCVQNLPTQRTALL